MYKRQVLLLSQLRRNDVELFHGLSNELPKGKMCIRDRWDIRMTGDVSEIANGFLSRELVAELTDSQ